MRRDNCVVGGALAAVLLVAFAPTWVALATLYARSGTYAHGFLVPLVAAHWAWLRRGRVAQAPDSARWPGLGAAALGSALVLLGSWYEAAFQPGYTGHLFLRAAGLLGVIVGLCILLLGWRRSVCLAGPLGLLLFALPLPDSWLTAATLPLRGLTAHLSSHVLRWLGVPVYRSGSVLELPCGVLGVAEACSGVRSIWVLLAGAVVLAAYGRLRGWRLAALMAAVPLVSVGANVLRVVASGLLLKTFGQRATQGVLHETLGAFTFVLSAGVLLFLSWRWGVSREGEARGSVARCEPVPPPSHVLAVVAAGLLVAAGLGGLIVRNHYAALYVGHSVVHAARQPLSAFPEQVGRFRRIATPALAAWELDGLRADDYLNAVYEAPDGERLRVTLIYWLPRRIHPGRRYAVPIPHIPDHCLPGRGWESVREYERDEPLGLLGQHSVSVRRFTREGVVQDVVYWREYSHPGMRPFLPTQLVKRLDALWRSWSSPPSALIGARYSVTIATQSSGGTGVSGAALEFARAAAGILSVFGLGDPEVVKKKTENTIE